MHHFPVTNSTLSSKHLAAFVKEKYNNSDAFVLCRLLKAGINDTYLIEGDSGKTIFRVYKFGWRTETEIKEEIRLLLLLDKKNIPVSYPIPDLSGIYIHEFIAPEGKRMAVMFSLADGEKRQNYSEETHFNIGTIMAKMHKETVNFRLERSSYNAQNLLVDSLNEIKRFLPEETTEMQFMRSAQKYLLNEYAQVNTEFVRYGAVHLDLWFDNLNIDQDGKVTIFDFDFCGNGWLCLDMAYYVLQVHSTEKDQEVCNAKVKSFIKGYESITDISDEEKRIIPMLGVSLYFFYLGIQSKRFDNFSNVFFNDVYLRRYITVLVKKYFDDKVLH